MEGSEEHQEYDAISSQELEQEQVSMDTGREPSTGEDIGEDPSCEEDTRELSTAEDIGVEPSCEEDTSLTTQWSVEDEEEAARERRRRAREEQLRNESENGIPNSSTPPESERAMEEDTFNFKPSEQNELEEDEGFSDWTQKLDRQRQKQAEEQEACTEREKLEDLDRQEKWQQEETGTIKSEEEERNHHVDGLQNEGTEESQYLQKEEEMLPDAEDDIWSNSKDEKLEERENNLTFSTVQHEMRSSSQSQDEDDGFKEAEAKLEKIKKSLEEKENQEYENLRQKQLEAEAELEELKKRQEERHRLRETVEYQRQQEEKERQARQEEEKQRMKEDIERRRMEATEKRLKKLSTSGSEGEEVFRPISPRSPTSKSEKEDRAAAETSFSITERTESLNRSVKKSNSIKKTHPVVPITKIEDKLEQYTHAIETSSKGVRHTSLDIPTVTEPVAAKKNLFETGDALSNVPRPSPCKDTEGLNVGVADLVHQWVKETSEASNKHVLSAASDIVPGDVGNIKNLWEHKGDSPSSKNTASASKGTSGSKKYKFVPTGHGKYEKIPLEDGESA